MTQTVAFNIITHNVEQIDGIILDPFSSITTNTDQVII